MGEEQPKEDGTEEPVVPEPPPSVIKPSFRITAPSDGEIIYTDGDTGEVTLSMSTQNLILKQPSGKANNGEGHFSITIDNDEVVDIASKVYTMENLELGYHEVSVELVNNDGSSYSPRITNYVSFTIEREAPDVYVPQTYTVKIKDFSYEPAQITVKATDSVTFVNQGNYPRSATCFIEGKQMFDTGVIGSGKSVTVTMDKVMECEYYSTTHMAMKGHIVVESNGVD